MPLGEHTMKTADFSRPDTHTLSTPASGRPGNTQAAQEYALF